MVELVRRWQPWNSRTAPRDPGQPPGCSIFSFTLSWCRHENWNIRVACSLGAWCIAGSGSKPRAHTFCQVPGNRDKDSILGMGAQYRRKLMSLPVFSRPLPERKWGRLKNRKCGGGGASLSVSVVELETVWSDVWASPSGCSKAHHQFCICSSREYGLCV